MGILDEFFTCSIIEELCNARFDEFESAYIKSVNNRKKLFTGRDYETEIISIIEKNITDESKKKVVYEKLNDLELCIFSDLGGSIKRAYKLGFVDGIKINKEVKQIVEESKNKEII